MIYVILVLFVVLVVLLIVNSVRKRKFVRLFTKGNVIVSGMKGRGKDMAFCIVVNARKRNYISNVQYSDPKKPYQRFDFNPKTWDINGNTYKNFIDGNLKKYDYPYPDGIDYYISDCGVYFPAQYQAELVKRYPSAPIFLALSRQLGDCSVHTNAQAQNRLWDKMREQSDIYVYMRRCVVIPHTKIVMLWAYEYERAESGENHIELPFFGIGKNARLARSQFEIAHGRISKHFFITKIPYRYDDRRFKTMLKGENENE